MINNIVLRKNVRTIPRHAVSVAIGIAAEKAESLEGGGGSGVEGT